MKRTKEDAEQTRIAILDAAERIFAERGVAASSLESISRAANVTRGAFYWHFKNKTDLLTAIRARRSLPQEELLSHAVAEGHDDPLGLLVKAAKDMLVIFESDEQQQRVFRIMLQQVDDPEIALWQSRSNAEVVEMLIGLTALAKDKGMLSADFTPKEAAILLMATMSGLLHEWMTSGRSFSLTVLGAKIIEAQMTMLRSD